MPTVWLLTIVVMHPGGSAITQQTMPSRDVCLAQVPFINVDAVAKPPGWTSVSVHCVGS